MANWIGLFLMAVNIVAHANSLSELEKIAAQAKTFDEFASSVVLKEKYFEALKKYQHRDRFRCESFDKIISKAKSIATKVPDFGRRLWEPMESRVIEIQAFRNDANASPLVPDSYTFRSVPRIFHALWNDPSMTGCYSDSCEEDDTNSPDRWAVTLKDAELYYAEKNGIYMDQSLLFLPLKRGDKQYRLIVAGGGPNLLRSISIWDGVRKQSYTTSLAKNVVGQLHNRFWKANHPEVIWDRGSRALASFNGGNWSAPVDDFVVPDPLAGAIENAQERKCLAKRLQAKSGAQLAFGKKSGLGSDEKLQKFPWNNPLSPNWNDTKAVAQMLGGNDFQNKLPRPDTLTPEEKETVDTQLTKVFSENSDPKLRARAGVALDLMNQVDPTKPRQQRTNPFVPIGIDSAASPQVQQAFLKGLSDPDPRVRAAAAIGAADTARPIPQKAFDEIENAFNPSNAAKNAADGAAKLLDRALAAADRGGLFSPKIDNAIDRKPSSKPDGIDPLTKLQRQIENQGKQLTWPETKKALDEITEKGIYKEKKQELTNTLADLMFKNPGAGSTAAALAWERNAKVDKALKQEIMNAALTIASQRSCGPEPKSEKTASRYRNPFCEFLLPSAWADNEEEASATDAAAAPHDSSDTRVEKEHTTRNPSGQNQWQCDDSGDTSAISDPLTPGRAYRLRVQFDKDQNRWKSVDKGTKGSMCRWFIADENGGLSLGSLRRGSYISAAMLGPSANGKGEAFIFVGDVPGPTAPKTDPPGWLKICPSVLVRGDMAFDPKGIDVPKSRDDVLTYRVSDLQYAFAHRLPIAEVAEKGRKEEEQRRQQFLAKGSRVALDRNLCSQANPPNFCGLTDTEYNAALACNPDMLYDAYSSLMARK